VLLLPQPVLLLLQVHLLLQVLLQLAAAMPASNGTATAKSTGVPQDS
jgi:hypothetical protein